MGMDDTPRTSRVALLAPLSGAAFILMFLGGSVLIGAFDYMPPADEIVSFYTDDSSRIEAGGYIVTISVFFLIWFSASLRSHLQVAEGGTGRLSTLAFGAGVLSGAIILLTSTITLVAASRADSDGGIGPNAATLAYDLAGGVTGSGLPIAMAAMIAATVVVSFRTGVFPKWLAWISTALVIGLLTPYNWAVLVLIIPWVLTISVWIYLDGRKSQHSAL